MAQLKKGTTIDGRDVMLEIDNKVDALAGAGNIKTVKQLDEEIIAHKNETAIHTKIIAIEEGTTEPPVENGALLIIYEAVSD